MQTGTGADICVGVVHLLGDALARLFRSPYFPLSLAARTAGAESLTREIVRGKRVPNHVDLRFEDRKSLTRTRFACP